MWASENAPLDCGSTRMQRDFMDPTQAQPIWHSFVGLPARLGPPMIERRDSGVDYEGLVSRG